MRRIRVSLIVFGLLILSACGRNASQGNLSSKTIKTANNPVAALVATAKVDRALISTEDPITFTLTVDRDESINVPIPDIGSLIKGFRIVDFGNDEKTEDKRVITRRWFNLRADATGSYILPEIELKYNQDGKEKSAKTSEIFVEVKAPNAGPSDGQEADIRDIKDIERSPSHLLAILAAFVTMCATAGIAWYLKKKRCEAQPDIPRLAPHEQALQRLEGLSLPLGSDSVALKRYYFALSEILRAYVEERYGFAATDMTCEEIVRTLRSNSSLPETEKPLFIEFLRETDIVKFTDYQPPEEAISGAKDRVRQFVVKTQPVVTQSEAVV